MNFLYSWISRKNDVFALFIKYLGIELKEFGITIDFGFELKGIINILGYNVSCRLKISLPDILIDVEMGPMTLGDGLFAVHRSLSDATNGPEFLEVQIKGAICFLGIQAEAQVLISKTLFRLQMSVNLFDFIYGNIFVEAKKGSFRASI